MSQNDPRRRNGDNVIRFVGPASPGKGGPRRDREPAFNAPIAAVALAAAMPALYAIQSLSGMESELLIRFGLIPALILDGRWWTPLSSLFLHGFWMHAILNGVAILAFGAPVARYLGERGAGPARFVGFFLVCGVIAGLGYFALQPHSGALVVGASGGAAGLMAAASRMISQPGRLSGLRDRNVLGLAAGWVIVNLAFVLFGFAPGAGGAPIAWEAHLIGYAAGLFAIGPFARLTRAR